MCFPLCPSGLPWETGSARGRIFAQKNLVRNLLHPAVWLDEWLFDLNTEGWSMLLGEKLFGI
jgi:hypothetical protein